MFAGVESDFLKGNLRSTQGSILGPVLFLVYTSDVVNATNHFSTRLFADDTPLTVTGKGFCFYCYNEYILNCQPLINGFVRTDDL